MREPMMVASRLLRYSTSEDTPLMYLPQGTGQRRLGAAQAGPSQGRVP